MPDMVVVDLRHIAPQRRPVFRQFFSELSEAVEEAAMESDPSFKAADAVVEKYRGRLAGFKMG
jgi:hypothetical protein